MDSFPRWNGPKRFHKPGVQLVNPHLVRVADFNDTLYVAQITQLKTGTIVEPAGWRKKDKGQDQHANDVILPTATLIRPEDRFLDDQPGSRPERGTRVFRHPVHGARNGWFAELGVWCHMIFNE